MKLFKYITLLLLTIVLISCRNDVKKAVSENEEASHTINNSKKVADETTKKEKNIQLLRDKDYLTESQWQSWLPETLLDMPRSFSQINFMPGLGSCSATYSTGNKRIKFMVIDGAGEKGAGGVGPFKMYSKTDYDTEDEERYKKTRVLEGVRVVESYRKTGNYYSLSMFYGERFGIKIETFELEQHALDLIFTELNLNELKNL